MTSNIEVVLGPPGTGKTTALLDRVAQELLAGTAPDRIAFVSFTRAARLEFLDRVGTRFGVGLDDFPWLRTVHGTAYRLLGQPEHVMHGGDWLAFAEEYGYRFTPVGRADWEEPIGASPRTTTDDLLRAMYDWGRSRCLTPEETLARCTATVGAGAFRRFVARYESFKRENDHIDFHDLLERATSSARVPPVEVAFVDEAQDLSPAQVRAVVAWFWNCRRVYVAGDDDQAIFAFQGAEPRWLLDLASAHPATVLPQSHRIPSTVHSVAERVIARNRIRVPKAYRPRAVAGAVDRLPLESAVRQVEAAKNAFILVRNRCFLDAVAALLRHRTVPYIVEGGGAANPLSPAILAAARAAQAIAAGISADANDFRAMLELIPSNGPGLLPHGVKEQAKAFRGSLDPAFIETLLRGGKLIETTRTEGPLAVLVNVTPPTRRYLEAVQKKYGSYIEPKVRLTTIHGAKGREADLVILVPDMTMATYRESVDQRHGGAEAENRVAYVGATRAKERLIIASPRTRNAYAYPRDAAVTRPPSQAIALPASS